MDSDRELRAVHMGLAPLPPWGVGGAASPLLDTAGGHSRRIINVDSSSILLADTVFAAGSSAHSLCTLLDRRTPSVACHGILFLQRVSAWHGSPPNCLQQQCVGVPQTAQSLFVSPAGLPCVSPSVPPQSFIDCHLPRLIQASVSTPPYLLRFLIPSTRRQGLAGRSNKSSNQGKGNGTPSPTTSGPYSPSAVPGQTPSFPPMPHSPALSSAMSFESQPTQEGAPSGSRRPPFFFREEYSSLIVRGNFMTLAAKPNLVEEGEWLAHQGTLFCRCSRGLH